VRIGALAVMTALLSLAFAACDEGPPPTCNPSGTDLHISVVKGTTHRFDQECLAAQANQLFTIEFQNHDTSSHGNHNIHIFDGSDDKLSAISPVTRPRSPTRLVHFKWGCSGSSATTIPR
jgi:hypothetical protein